MKWNMTFQTQQRGSDGHRHGQGVPVDESGLAAMGTRTGSDEDALARRIAAAACADAVVAWCGDGDRAAALAKLAEAMAQVRRALNGSLQARGLDELLDLLHRPLSEWLNTPVGPLLAGAMPTMDCEDLRAEGGHDPEAELIQRQVGIEVRGRLRRRDDGQAIYTAFRRFLIDHPVAEEGAILHALRDTGLALGALFERIPSSHADLGRDLFWPCPHCGWPMRLLTNALACDAPQCREQGAHRPLTAAIFDEAAGARPGRGQYRLRRGAWRYTLLPGLAERDLATKLAGLGAEVALWPYLDAYDLDVRHGERHWRIDVKDWADPGALWRYLQRLPEDTAELIIVVPDRRRWQLDYLHEREAATHLRFLDARGLAREVKEAAQ